MFLLCYFHSHTLTEQFPCSSPTYSKTPTMLSRNDNFPPPVKVVRKNTEPWNLIFLSLVNLPILAPYKLLCRIRLWQILLLAQLFISLSRKMVLPSFRSLLGRRSCKKDGINKLGFRKYEKPKCANMSSYGIKVEWNYFKSQPVAGYFQIRQTAQWNTNFGTSLEVQIRPIWVKLKTDGRLFYQVCSR